MCLVDLNWCWPSVSPLVDPSLPSLASVVAGKADLNDAIVTTSLQKLSMIPAGTLSQWDRPIVARSYVLKEILLELGRRFDHLILDIPAILSTNDAVPLASLGTACCMVIRQRATTTDEARNALDEIAHLKILGVVMNRVSYSTPSMLLKWVATR